MSTQTDWDDFQIIELSYVIGNITNTTYQKLKPRNNFTVFDNGVLILNLMPATHFQKKNLSVATKDLESCETENSWWKISQ